MSDVLSDVLPMAQKGYCCSQILVKLILDAQGEENPGLMRALSGLCKGMASRHGTCGLLTGGVCALAYVTGKGSEDERAHVMAEEMRYKYLAWFREATERYGSMNCVDILGDASDNFGPHCGDLLTMCWEKIVEIFDEYDIDPTMPPDE